MRWTEVRQAYPHHRPLIEALEAHSEGNRRMLDRIAVVETSLDSTSAMQSYRRLHQQDLLREFYFVHTAREEEEIVERRWVGIRRNDETRAHG